MILYTDLLSYIRCVDASMEKLKRSNTEDFKWLAIKTKIATILFVPKMPVICDAKKV